MKRRKEKRVKFSRAERTTIAISDLQFYDIYKCHLHGMYSPQKENQNKLCPYCKRECPCLNEVIEPLQEQYRKEIL